MNLGDCTPQGKSTATLLPGAVPGSPAVKVISHVEEAMFRSHMLESPYDGLSYQSKSAYILFSASGPYAVAKFKPFYFPPDKDLNCENSMLRGIELISSTQESANPAGVDNVPLAQMAQGFLVLSNRRKEILVRTPLYNVNTPANGSKICRFWLNEQYWANCYVELTDTTGFSTSVGLHFRIWYENVNG